MVNYFPRKDIKYKIYKVGSLLDIHGVITPLNGLKNLVTRVDLDSGFLGRCFNITFRGPPKNSMVFSTVFFFRDVFFKWGHTANPEIGGD